MKPCTNCGNMLADDAAYCNACNTSQNAFEQFEPKPPYNDTFLKVLCILTILGSVLSLVSIPISYTTSATVGVEIPMFMTVIGVVVALGKLTGAIFMLKKKLAGLYIYTVAAVGGLASAIYSIFMMTEKMGEIVAALSGTFSIVFIIAFLVMYWLPVNRRLLS